jgi:hypothetical protein
LDQFSAVCVLDPGPLSPSTWQQLSAYAAAGGGVAIFLGRNARPMESFNEAAPQEILPGKLVRQWRAADGTVYLAPDNLQHPVLAKFKSIEGTIPWKAFPVFRHWQLGSLDAGAAVIAAYSDNQPAIIEKPVGKGRVITVTTPVSDSPSGNDPWNVLLTGEEPWPFAKLSQFMMYYLVGNSESRLNYLAGQSAVLHLPSGQPHATFMVTTPRGDQIRQSIDERQNVLVVAATDLPGNYRGRAGGGAQRVELGFSVNLPPEASLLERASEKDLKAVFGDANFQLARNREEINRKVNLGRMGYELYPFLLVLLVLVLAAEQILSNRFYGHDPAGAPGASPGGRPEPATSRDAAAPAAGSMAADSVGVVAR